MEETWLEIGEYCELSGLSRHQVAAYVNEGMLKTKEEEGEIFIEASSGTQAVIPRVSSEVMQEEQRLQGGDFFQKTIGTILSLHEKVLLAKDETIGAIKEENQFLKDALFQMQDVYDDDKKTIDTLSQQLRIAQEELEFMKRKYRLMWGRVSEQSQSPAQPPPVTRED